MNRTIGARLVAACTMLAAAAGAARAGNVQGTVERLAAGEPMTVAECVAIAAELNPSLRASERSAEATDRAVLQAYSNFLPSVNSNLRGSRSSGKQLDQLGRTETVRFDNFSAGFSVSQNLFTYSGFRSITGARKRRDASWAGYEAGRQDLVLQVKQAFYNVLMREDLLDVSVENLRVGEEQLKLAEKRREVGAGVIADVLKAKAQVESNRLDVITSEKNLATGKAELLAALGLDVTLPIDVEAPGREEPAVPDFRESLEAALDQRPDLKQWELSHRAAKDGIGQARGEWIPSLAGNFNYGWQDDQLGTGLFDDINEGWTASFSLNFPLLDGGTVSRIRQNQARAEEAKWNLETTRQAVALDVQEAILSIEENVKKMDVAERNISAAEEDLRVSQGKYQHGLVPILDLIEAQAGLAEAKAQGVEAYYNYLSSEAAWANAVGRKE